MKTLTIVFMCYSFYLLAGCGNSSGTENKSAGKSESAQQSVSSQAASDFNPQGSIVGEWDAQYTVYDLNRNKRMDANEEHGEFLGSLGKYLRFNEDGSCEYMNFFKKDQQSTYEVKFEEPYMKIKIKNLVAPSEYYLMSAKSGEMILSSPTDPWLYDVYRKR